MVAIGGSWNDKSTYNLLHMWGLGYTEQLDQIHDTGVTLMLVHVCCVADQASCINHDTSVLFSTPLATLSMGMYSPSCTRGGKRGEK